MPTPPHRVRKPVDVTIVGGGVVGLACAYFMNRAGMSVRILEKHKMGQGASFGNMGMLTPSHAHALCRPENLKLGMRSLLSPKAPIKVTLTPEIRRFKWFARFAAQCTEERARQVLKAKADILTASRELTEKLIALERIDCDFDARGIMSLAKTEAGMQSLLDLVAEVEPLGIPTEVIDSKALVRRDPSLRGDLAGGVLFPADASLNPADFCAGLRDVVSAKGVEIFEDTDVTIIHQDEGAVESVFTNRGTFPAKCVVVASGVWSESLVKDLKIPLPLEPGKGYSLTTRRPHPCPEVPLILVERNMAVTPWENGYRIGGTMELAGFDDHPTKARLMALIDGAMDYLLEPIAPGAPKEWCGFRPLTPDDLPIIGPAGPRNLYFACGHNMLGISMAASTGRLITEMISGRKPHLDPTPYAPTRFAKQPAHPFSRS